MSSKSLKLTIELVPRTSWYSNVRSNVTAAQWNKIRTKSYAHAGYKCEICGDVGQNQGVKHAVECHEIWHYDDENKIQKLTGLISLCPNCHRVKHAGKAQLDGLMYIVIHQLQNINDMTEDEVMNYIIQSFAIWRERSKHEWTLDINYLDEYLT